MQDSLLRKEFVSVDIAPMITLMRLSFSPAAVSLERYAMELSKDSVIRVILCSAARLVSCLTSHKEVKIMLGDRDPEDECRALIQLNLQFMWTNQRLFSGNNVAVSPALASMMLWNFNRNKRFLDVYSALKRVDHRFSLTMDEYMAIPSCFGMYHSRVHIPSPELMVIHSSILK